MSQITYVSSSNLSYYDSKLKDHIDDIIENEVAPAIDLKANIASPSFTGTPTAPTASVGTNTTQVATTAFVQSAIGSAIDNYY